MPENEQGKDPETRDSADLRAVLTSEGFSRRDKEYDEAADRAIRDRPAFSIRTRLILFFSLLFLFTLFITIWIINVLAGVHDRILFLEAADDYKVEIQQARRFEKNFLLYGTNLEDALEHARTAQRLSEENAERFRKVVGKKTLQEMNQHLAAYLQLLDSVGHGDRAEYEAELREQGAKVFTLAQEFVVKERRMVHSILGLTRRVPFYFLGGLFVLMALVLAFLARYIVQALSRFIGYTDRIASGDFTPITPRRRYRDEFSMLALNINRMVRELDHQHNVLMESSKLRAMGNLVSGVAHELNNPMNNILLTASLLQEEYNSLEDSEKQEMLQDLVTQVERTKKIVRNLLDFARHSETKVESLDLATILDETVQLVSNQLRMKKVRLKMDIPEVLPAVHGDRHLLGQVFMNLIINALDVLPEKGEIRISTDTDRRDGFLGVDVTDNGPGMPGHVLSQIFDPFFTTKPKARGTGLGLSVSRGIVRKLGGYLLVESQLGVGSTFTVLLPVTTIPSEISSRPEGAESEEVGS